MLCILLLSRCVLEPGRGLFPDPCHDLLCLCLRLDPRPKKQIRRLAGSGVAYRVRHHLYCWTTYYSRMSSSGFEEMSSPKPCPQANVCLKLASEMDKDGMVTLSEPLCEFARNDTTNLKYFTTGHVKGQACTSTALAALLYIYQTGLKVKDALPKLWATCSTIAVIFENNSTLTSIALRNSQLSHRGSIRERTCALGWVGMIYKLVDCGALRSTDDGSALLKQYNAIASTSGIVQGAQRQSILNLLNVPHDAVAVMIVGSEHGTVFCGIVSAWHD